MLELALSIAGATPAETISYFAIKRTVRAVRRGKDRRFLARIVAEPTNVREVAITLRRDNIIVADSIGGKEYSRTFEELTLVALAAHGTELAAEFRSVAATLGMPVGHGIVFVAGLDDIRALSFLETDIAALGILAGWPCPRRA
jgi:hypothetical protein